MHSSLHHPRFSVIPGAVAHPAGHYNSAFSTGSVQYVAVRPEAYTAIHFAWPFRVMPRYLTEIICLECCFGKSFFLLLIRTDHASWSLLRSRFMGVLLIPSLVIGDIPLIRINLSVRTMERMIWQSMHVENP